MESRRLVGGDAEFVGVSVMPDFFHVVPVGNDAVFNGIFQRQNTWSNTLGVKDSETEKT